MSFNSGCNVRYLHPNHSDIIIPFNSWINQDPMITKTFGGVFGLQFLSRAGATARPMPGKIRLSRVIQQTNADK